MVEQFVRLVGVIIENLKGKATGFDGVGAVAHKVAGFATSETKVLCTTSLSFGEGDSGEGSVGIWGVAWCGWPWSGGGGWLRGNIDGVGVRAGLGFAIFLELAFPEAIVEFDDLFAEGGVRIGASGQREGVLQAIGKPFVEAGC